MKEFSFVENFVLKLSFKNYFTSAGKETVDKLMSISNKYQTPWISTPIQDYIINKKDGGEFVSMEFVNYENCARNIQG